MEFATEVYFYLLAAVCVFLWLFRLGQGFPLLKNRKRDPSPLGFLDVLLVFGGWILGQVLALGILSSGGVEFSGEGATTEGKAKALIVLSGVQLLATLLCLVVIRIRYRRSSAVGLDLRNWKNDLSLGFFGFLMIVPPVLLVQVLLSLLVPYSHNTIETLKESQSMLPLYGAWFSAVLCAPIVEEVFFRGTLQSWMQRLGNTELNDFGPLIFGGDLALDKTIGTKGELLVGDRLKERQVEFDSKLRWTPIFVCAALFAAMHVGQGAAPIPLFLLAVGLGYLYRQTGSIVPCLMVHVLLNLQTIFLVTMNTVFGSP